uniref:Uncharacterized protein n=3 Tax=commelinids TaxID=4734 RepID=A0A0Q3SQC0_SETIT
MARSSFKLEHPL